MINTQHPCNYFFNLFLHILDALETLLAKRRVRETRGNERQHFVRAQHFQLSSRVHVRNFLQLCLQQFRVYRTFLPILKRVVKEIIFYRRRAQL